MGSQENTGENSKRRRQLVRQSAKTETDLECCEVAEEEGEGEEEELGSPSQCRIIYKETIDISASLPPVSPPQSWLYGSSRILAAQYSGQSFNRSEA